MTLPVEKYQTLAERLYTLTDEKRLHWQFDYRNDLYCDLGTYKVFVYSGEDADGSPLITVSIKKSGEDAVDTFYDTTLSDQPPKVKQFSTYWRLMSALYTAAYRTATGADQALDEVLKALDAEDDVPF